MIPVGTCVELIANPYAGLEGTTGVVIGSTKDGTVMVQMDDGCYDNDDYPEGIVQVEIERCTVVK
jgi:hypothetical protein